MTSPSRLTRRAPLPLLGAVAGTLANLAPGMTMFLSLPVVLAATGAGAPWSFALAACAMLAVGNTMAEFARMLPSAGSFVTYISNGFAARSRRGGAALGIVSFYLLLLSFPLTQAAGLTFLGWWAAGLLGWSGGAAWVGMALLAVAAGMPLLLRGVAVGHRGALALFLFEAAVLTAIVVAAAAHVGGGVARPLHADALRGIAALPGLPFALAMFCYIGWEHAGSLAEETIEPRRTIPRAIVLSLLIVCLLYMGVAWAAACGLGGGDRSAAANPLLALAHRYLPGGAWLVALVGCTSPFACFLAETASQARILYNGAREGLLPRAVASVRPGRPAPHVAIGLYVGLAALLVVAPALAGASPVQIFTVEAGVGTMPILLVYLLATLALPLYMWRVRRPRFSVVRHALVPAVGAAMLIYGIVAFIRPDQPAPGDRFWLETGVILACSLAAAGWLLRHRPSALDRIGSILADGDD